MKRQYKTRNNVDEIKRKLHSTIYTTSELLPRNELLSQTEQMRGSIMATPSPINRLGEDYPEQKEDKLPIMASISNNTDSSSEQRLSVISSSKGLRDSQVQQFDLIDNNNDSGNEITNEIDEEIYKAINEDKIEIESLASCGSDTIDLRPLESPNWDEFSADLQYRGEYVWQVSVWDPNEFTLNLHCGISPVHIGIIILMQPDYWIYYIGLLILLTFQMYININKYASLVKDRQAIYGEVQRVYDAKFVKGKNKVPITKQSISTQTNAFDAFDINMAQNDQEMNQLFMNFRDIDPWANDSTNSSTVD
ncbi:1216_t:CDS:2 [Diversispora eburnea]|uniref:1216_t:CDS:1 n=1 Tax=Diversispora eburnea TaxID=1213867 RepID=A0A9N8Z805_9GLOM|nr:1216_t:CDS:2 [Diversispora eburnea]